MKRFVLLVSFSVCLILSCTNAITLEGTGTLRLKIAEPQQTKRSFTNATAAAVADVYDVFAYSGTNHYYTTISIGSTSSLNLPAGTYTIIALAGKNIGSSAYLVGSSEVDNVIINAGYVTDVSIVLQCLVASLNYPTNVNIVADATYTISATFDLHSRNIGFEGVPIGIEGDGYTGTSGKTIWRTATNGTISTYSGSFTSPTLPSTANITAGGSTVILHSNYILDTSNAPHYWRLPTYHQFSELESDLYGTINFYSATTGTTGISITIGWGA